MNKTQKGFALIEGLLIVLILVIVGFGGYYVWQNQNNAANSNAQKSEASLSNSNSIQDTKTFTAPREKFTLKYPSSWTVESGPNTEQYSLKAPDGLLVSYTYLETLDQEDGGCGHGSLCVNQKILSIDSVKPSNHADIQLIKTAPDESEECYGVYLNEADAVHKPKVGTNHYDDSSFFYSLKDISGAGRFTVQTSYTWGGTDSFDCKNLTETQFFNTKSVQEAEKILRSISFQSS